MLEIKRLAECTLEQGVQAWNTGFEGYYFDATTTVENFVNRLVLEGLSPRLSIIAFKDNQPVGIVKNGVRTFTGKKIAWNGGTGVASAYRKHGIGKALMEATLTIYKEEGIHFATLEAISENQKAISLYEKIGYETVDQLEYLQLKGSLKDYSSDIHENYLFSLALPQQVGYLPFYKGLNPWQTGWQSARDGEAIIVKDDDGSEIGYAYYRRTLDSDGNHEKTVLFQCEAHPNRKDAEQIVQFMLSQIFGSFSDTITRIVPNVPVNRSQLTYSILKEIGFDPFVKQVFMVKEL